MISYGNDNKWRYYYQKDYYDPRIRGFLTHEIDRSLFTKLYLSDLAEDSIQKVWDCLVQNNLFGIYNTDTSKNNCPRIFDSNTYIFYIFTNHQFKKISYYSPEFLDANCPLSNDRKRIRNCVKAFAMYLKDEGGKLLVSQ